MDAHLSRVPDGEAVERPDSHVHDLLSAQALHHRRFAHVLQDGRKDSFFRAVCLWFMKCRNVDTGWYVWLWKGFVIYVQYSNSRTSCQKKILNILYNLFYNNTDHTVNGQLQTVVCRRSVP